MRARCLSVSCLSTVVLSSHAHGQTPDVVMDTAMNLARMGSPVLIFDERVGHKGIYVAEAKSRQWVPHPLLGMLPSHTRRLIGAGETIFLAPGRSLTVVRLADKADTDATKKVDATYLKPSTNTNAAEALTPGDTQHLAGEAKTVGNKPYTVYTSESLLTVPESGQLQVTDNFDEKVAVIEHAPLFRLDNAFQPYFLCPFGGSPAFGLATPEISFANNGTLRLDGVGIFSADKKDPTSFGQAISYSNYLGTPYDESTRHVIGFPIRFTLTFGIKGFSFSDKTFGTTPFVGFGISIPIGK